MMIAVGLYLSGWLPQLANIERVGVPLWKKLEPIGRRLLPVSSPFKALAYGIIWGWLPCGMVYFVLIWALSAGSAIQGAAIMLAFGLGTLPTLLAAGFMTSWLKHFASNPRARDIAGLLIIAMAIGSLFIPMDHNNNNADQPVPMDHSEHMHHH
ncbi:MAG: sulfite exporter TauE/SafE family protein, partial [Gammaproteobacteria bacterium]|nr:sulfite exporter TauE/SafE family protein [Gammaproteobacteria bacterium]